MKPVTYNNFIFGQAHLSMLAESIYSLVEPLTTTAFELSLDGWLGSPQEISREERGTNAAKWLEKHYANIYGVVLAVETLSEELSNILITRNYELLDELTAENLRDLITNMVPNMSNEDKRKVLEAVSAIKIE